MIMCALAYSITPPVYSATDIDISKLLLNACPHVTSKVLLQHKVPFNPTKIQG